MIELEVHNFQSVRHVSMVVDGFAAIVGRSNIGKSAVVRAAQYALTGALGTDFVRHGQDCDRRVRKTKKCKCFSKVRIKTSSIEVLWEKGDNINRYTVTKDGVTEVWNGLDRGTPKFLLPDFQLVKIGDRKELIQVPDQFKPIFLLNQSGPAVADVLSDVAQLEDVNKALAMASKDRKDNIARKKVREEDVETLKGDLIKYDGLDNVPVDDLTTRLSSLGSKQDLLRRVTVFIGKVVVLETARRSLVEALKPSLPDDDLLAGKSRQYFQADAFFERLSELAPTMRRLKGVEGVTLPDEIPLQDYYSKLLQSEGLLQRLGASERALEYLLPVEGLQVPDNTLLCDGHSLLLRIAGFLKHLTSLETDLARYSGVAAAPEVDVEPLQLKVSEFGKVQGFVDRMRALQEAFTGARDQLKAAQEEVSQTHAELEALGMCPTCDQPIGESHRLHLEAV